MLTESAIFLAAAVLAVPLFKRLGLGSVLGYLAGGIAIGPSGLGLIHEVEGTLHFAELGVVLLLFLIGLELQPSRLWKMRNGVFGAGGAQVLATTLALAGVGVALGASFATAIVAGLALAMSSTAFALQVLGEKNELTAPHGRAAFGVLLFQDLAAIPALALIPLLGQPTGPAMDLTTQLPLVFGVIAAVILGGRFLIRPLFRFVAQAKSHELSTALALFVVVGTGLLMQFAGLSMALGAFLAGVVLADCEYRHELEANIEPFKGLLLGLFFMAVGMAANLHLLIQQPLIVLGLVVLLLAVKSAVLWGMGRLMRLKSADAWSLAIAISQGGEFAFVIFGVARQAQVISAPLVELLIVVVTLSMVATPLLFIIRDKALARQNTPEARAFDEINQHGARVIIAGFGRYGQIVARILRSKRIPFVALEISPAQVDFVRRFGNLIYYGDASRPELLRAAKAEQAEVFVLAIDDPEASVKVAQMVRLNFPQLTILARARNRNHALKLKALGITHVMRETFPASLETGRVTLETLGLSTHDALESVRVFKQFDEENLEKQVAIQGDEQALIASAKEVSAQLERLFEQDR